LRPVDGEDAGRKQEFQFTLQEDDMLNIAIEAAREAGQFLIDNVGRVRSIEIKQGEERNLVSEIDKGSEALIITRIKDKYPGHAILAEESGASGTGAEYTWIIDPLDGTTNYLHGIPIFSVTIGIERRGELVAGVIFDPNRNEIYTVEQGGGAFCNGIRLTVSRSSTLISSVIVTGFPYDITENPGQVVEHFESFLMEARGLRRLGSAAIDLAYVAQGRFDGFYEGTLHTWDMAAGVLLVREAGGQVTDFAGRPIDIRQKTIVASNGIIHDAMMDVLRRSS
jgi:myo-inositol-1(or 4)-monophosphatase